jgi:hypothetical protein
MPIGFLTDADRDRLNRFRPTLLQATCWNGWTDRPRSW